VLKGVEAKTQELNEHILPPDVKVHPYYDRSDLVQLTIDTVEHNLLMGMILVFVVLMAFLVSFRAAVIVALTIPLSLLFAFIFVHAEGIPANLLSIGAIDFGILIDGTLVMVENIFRELGAREGQQYDLEEVIKNAAKDVDRPIFYSVAVIIAGYLPIYALTGPSGKLFKPMADTVAHCAGGGADSDADACPRALRHVVQEGRARKREQAISSGSSGICGVAGLVHGPAA
jgi:cobalt-zinc-cadmium resistance protein CzcA